MARSVATFKIKMSKREAAVLWCFVDSLAAGPGDKFFELARILEHQFDSIQPACDVLDELDDDDENVGIEDEIDGTIQAVLDRTAGAKSGPEEGLDIQLTGDDVELIREGG